MVSDTTKHYPVLLCLLYTSDAADDLIGVDTDEPDLFNTENQASTAEDLLGSSDEDQEEDDLEIPAFLRRQKN